MGLLYVHTVPGCNCPLGPQGRRLCSPSFADPAPDWGMVTSASLTGTGRDGMSVPCRRSHLRAHANLFLDKEHPMTQQGNALPPVSPMWAASRWLAPSRSKSGAPSGPGVFDHIGPTHFAPGAPAWMWGPHIALQTFTWMLEGRSSTGTAWAASR